LYDRQISDFRFGLGEPFVINEIADHLRVSATPVRESLIRLKCEGFLDGAIRHGFVTKVLTVK
jgi:DNA-binding GntR family transcriptional regulator